MTVSPVISGAPAQTTAKTRPSGGSDDSSKSFYSYLLSSAQDDAKGSPSGSVAEPTAKTGKNEKGTGKKAEVNLAANMINLPVPPQTQQPTPSLSIAALLGSPTVEKTDTGVVETGKAANDGEAVLSLSDSESSADAGQKPTAKLDSPNNTALALEGVGTDINESQPAQGNLDKGGDVSIQPEPGLIDNSELPLTKSLPKADNQTDDNLQVSPKSLQTIADPELTAKVNPAGPKPDKAETPRSQRRDSNNGVTPAIDPALLSAVAPQSSPINIPKENSNTAPASSISAATGNEANASSPDPLTANALPGKAESASTPGNIAFALRLSEEPMDSKVESAAPQTPPAEPVGGPAQAENAALATVVQAVAGPQLKEQSQHGEDAGTVAFYQAPQTHQGSVSDAPPSSREQVAHSSAASLPANQEVAASEPVRNVHMQVVGDNNSRVDVHLMDRGGELHVSVKSGDINLTQNLQDHMPELTSRLEQQRFQAEVWVPKLADNGKTETSGARDFSSNESNHSNSSNPDQQGKRQGQYQPDWVDVLENSTRSTGKTDQIWPQ